MWATLAVLFLLVQSSDHAAEGLKALGSGEYETAAEAFRKAVAADPSDYSAHFNLTWLTGSWRATRMGLRNTAGRWS